MWWDVDRGHSAVDLTGDAEVVADAALLAMIDAMGWDELHLLTDLLREIELHLQALPRLEFRGATVESEAEFVDRPIDGEVVLVAPDEDDVVLIAADLNRQILDAPPRWRLDLHENLCGLLESRLEREPRSHRIRSRVVGRVRRLDLRWRALRRLRA